MYSINGWMKDILKKEKSMNVVNENVDLLFHLTMYCFLTASTVLIMRMRATRLLI